MNRTLELRLAKLETSHVPSRLTHEDWLAILAAEPPRTLAEIAADEARTRAALIAEFGSLAAAATAARTRADRTGDFMDDLIAEGMERRATESGAHG